MKTLKQITQHAACALTILLSLLTTAPASANDADDTITHERPFLVRDLRVFGVRLPLLVPEPLLLEGCHHQPPPRPLTGSSTRPPRKPCPSVSAPRCCSWAPHHGSGCEPSSASPPAHSGLGRGTSARPLLSSHHFPVMGVAVRLETFVVT